MLDVFGEELYGWRYTEFSRLDKYIRQIFKKTIITKNIYMGKPGGYINQYFVNLFINEQIPT